MSDGLTTNELRVRPSKITEIRDRRVPAAAVRLVRWDQRSPQTVFRHGLEPAVSKNPEHVTIDDLRDAKVKRLPSPFVFTTNCFADRNSSTVTRWTPYSYDTLARSAELRELNHVPRNEDLDEYDNLTRSAVLYEYELYKAGGYDVDRSLSGFDVAKSLSSPNVDIAFPTLDPRARKGDVAFAGPIVPAFIRSATEYDASGNPVRYWINGSFDIGANGKDMPKSLQIPPHVYPPGLPAKVWTPRGGANQPLNASNINVNDDAMFTFQGGQHPLFVGDAFSHPRPRACVLVPGQKAQFFFFTDTRVVQFILRQEGGQFSTSIVGNGAVNISASWPSLNKRGLATVDAIKDLGNGQARFFSGRRHVDAKLQSSVSVTVEPTDEIVRANNVVEVDVLRQVEFATVDAIWVPGPIEEKKSAEGRLKVFDVYYFQGTQCAIVRTVTNTTTNTVTDSVLEGPVLISRRFRALGDAGFTTVDTFVGVPGSGEVFVFSGTDYLRATSNLATIKDGPVPVSSAVWGALTESGFY